MRALVDSFRPVLAEQPSSDTQMTCIIHKCICGTNRTKSIDLGMMRVGDVFSLYSTSMSFSMLALIVEVSIHCSVGDVV